jgi:hypothetical protein
VQYYDAPIVGISQIVVNHAVSMVGMFSNRESMSTMLFTDSSVVLQHENFATSFISKCIPLFENFTPSDMPSIIANMPHLRRKKAFYSFLPVPAFVAVDIELVKDILHTNGIEPTSEEYKNVMDVNTMFHKISGLHNAKPPTGNNETVLIFQLEKMLARVKKGTFVSSSLTHFCHRDIVIQPRQHALELRQLIKILQTQKNIHVVLASEKDVGSLPSMNCWCMLDSYVIQMYDKGFRFCEESTVVSTASNALVRCMHKVPPTRRDNFSVINYLGDMAKTLEQMC